MRKLLVLVGLIAGCWALLLASVVVIVVGIQYVLDKAFG